jgi:hypothetical protein
MQHKIRITEAPLTCQSIAYVDWSTRQNDLPCGTETMLRCGYCFEGVCVLCSDSCFECAVPLHDGCRDDHAKETGHSIDVPKKQPQFVSDLDKLVDRVCKLVDAA